MSPSNSHPAYQVSADPDDPQWTLYQPSGQDGLNTLFGSIRVRVDGPAQARCRVEPLARHLNINGDIHGGFTLALIDQSLFLAPQSLGIPRALHGVTLDTSTQFFGPLHGGAPIDVVVEVLRHTRRLIFMRGLVEQNGEPGVAFSGTVRKANEQ